MLQPLIEEHHTKTLNYKKTTNIPTNSSWCTVNIYIPKLNYRKGRGEEREREKRPVDQHKQPGRSVHVAHVRLRIDGSPTHLVLLGLTCANLYTYICCEVGLQLTRKAYVTCRLVCFSNYHSCAAAECGVWR